MQNMLYITWTYTAFNFRVPNDLQIDSLKAEIQKHNVIYNNRLQHHKSPLVVKLLYIIYCIQENK